MKIENYKKVMQLMKAREALSLILENMGEDSEQLVRFEFRNSRKTVFGEVPATVLEFKRAEIERDLRSIDQRLETL